MIDEKERRTKMTLVKSNEKTQWKMDGVVFNLKQFDTVYKRVGQAYRLPYLLSVDERVEYIEALGCLKSEEIESTFLWSVFEDEYVEKLVKIEKSIITENGIMTYEKLRGKSAAKIVVSILWILNQSEEDMNIMMGKIYRMTSSVNDSWRFARVMAVIDLMEKMGKSFLVRYEEQNQIRYVDVGYYKDKLDSNWFKKGLGAKGICWTLDDEEWDIS